MYHKLVDVTTSCGPTAAPQCGESAPLACTRWFWGFMRPIGQLPRLHLFGVWFDTPVFAAASWQFCLVFLLRRSSCRKRERTVGAWAAPITRPAATTSRFGTRASQVKSPALPWLVSIHDSLDPMHVWHHLGSFYRRWSSTCGCGRARPSREASRNGASRRLGSCLDRGQRSARIGDEGPASVSHAVAFPL